MRVAEGATACAEHAWVTADQVMAWGEVHLVRVCRSCPSVALVDEPSA
ncbi:hypothetical protein [Knoellia locipacati]|nr:hypothetical protein [Knoellia locipacati]